MIQLTCQWLLLIGLFLKFFCLAKQDFDGQPEKKPSGFPGLVATCFVVALSAIVTYFSGALSLLPGW